MLSFFHTTEFYIILFIAAAAIVALAAMPARRGPVREELLGADLLPGAALAEPSIEVECRGDGSVLLFRHGLAGMRSGGAVSAKVEVNGFNITVYERVSPPCPDDYSAPVSTACFTLDFLGSERYFLRYESENTSAAATIAFRNIPGYHPRPVSLKQ